MRALALLALAIACVGCARGERTTTVYLEHRLGPDGPRGQVAPVLEPVGRERRPELSEADEVLHRLSQGPTPGERAAGMRAPVSEATVLRIDRIDRGTAHVRAGGRPLDTTGVASVVFSLTELEDVVRVRVCCLHRHDGTRVFVHTRASFRGWQGEPCAERRANRCLRDR